MCKLDVFDA